MAESQGMRKYRPVGKFSGLRVGMNRFRADLVLLSVALIWGSVFAVQRVAARYFDAFTFNGLHFLLGGLVLLPFARLNPLRSPKPSRENSDPQV
jgi:drug/metabolite transporter (DMT)-like permease